MMQLKILRKLITCLLCVFLGLSCFAQRGGNSAISVADRAEKGYFPLVTQNEKATLYYDTADAKVVCIAVRAFQQDCALVCGAMPSLDSGNADKEFVVIAGTIGKNKLIDALVGTRKLIVNDVIGKWETFSITVLDKPMPGVKQALVIAGSDPRGTAFGIFELSKIMGVSPLYWWADATSRHRDEIYFTKGKSIVGPPSVKNINK